MVIFDWKSCKFKMDKTECDKWRHIPNRNPRTNRQITIDGPTYRKIAKDCDTAKVTPFCEEWKKNPTTNPATKRKIKIGGPIYNRFAMNCTPSGTQVSRALPTSPPKALPPRALPPSSSLEYASARSSLTSRPSSPSSSSYPNPLHSDNLQAPEDFFATRESKEARVTEGLEKINASQWEMCITGKHSKFRDSLGNVILLGRGSYGEVYETTIDGNPVVIKEAYLLPDDKKNLADKIIRKKMPQNSYPKEFALLSQVKQLIKQDICPNFLYAYDVALCEGCIIGNNPGSCYVTFTEPADGDLFTHIETWPLNSNELTSILYQMLLAVHSLHSNLGIIHKDIKTDNFLVKYVEPGGFLEYTIKNAVCDHTFYVENTGIIVMLADFGLSISLNPTQSVAVGARNAKVINNGSSLEFLPIVCRKYAPNSRTLTPQKTMLQWTDGTISTPNDIVTTSSYYLPDTTINIYDFVEFPAFEFFYDVMDVIHLFTGGTRMLGSANSKHLGVKTLPRDLYQKLNGVSKDRFDFDKHDVKSIVACEMLKTLYTEIEPPSEIISSYASK